MNADIEIERERHVSEELDEEEEDDEVPSGRIVSRGIVNVLKKVFQHDALWRKEKRQKYFKIKLLLISCTPIDLPPYWA